MPTMNITKTTDVLPLSPAIHQQLSDPLEGQKAEQVQPGQCKANQCGMVQIL